MAEFMFINYVDNLLNPDNEINIIGYDPLNVLSDRQFIQMFRISKDLFRFLKNILQTYIKDKVRPTDLSVADKILVALKFFASGSYQLDVGKNLHLNVSQSSVSRCIKEVIEAINQPDIFNEYIKFPQNFQELNSARLQFFKKYNFPGVIGCIDCTHIAIYPPKIGDPDYPEHIYVNRKGYHSINVQLICDANMKIININARYPGSTNDAFIWNNSNVQTVLQQLHARGHTDYFLLGDSGYPLRSWCLTPLENEPAVNTPEYVYNHIHKSTRNIIERCNGLLKMRFRCCLKHRVLHYDPETACKIINSCAFLHNLCIEYNVPEPENNDDEEDIDFGIYAVLQQGILENLEENGIARINEDLVMGRAARQNLIHNIFRHRI